MQFVYEIISVVGFVFNFFAVFFLNRETLNWNNVFFRFCGGGLYATFTITQQYCCNNNIAHITIIHIIYHKLMIIMIRMKKGGLGYVEWWWWFARFKETCVEICLSVCLASISAGMSLFAVCFFFFFSGVDNENDKLMLSVFISHGWKRFKCRKFKYFFVGFFLVFISHFEQIFRIFSGKKIIMRSWKFVSLRFETVHDTYKMIFKKIYV